MLKKNEEITLNIDSCTSLGSGVGRYNGLTVFVANTAPGDHVLAHIIKAKPNYAIGKLVKVIHPSPMRINPECNVSKSCGGCAFSHIKYSEELKIKQTQVKENFLRLAGIEANVMPIISSVSQSRYRNKAQYPVRADKYNLAKIGFYSEHSHNVIDCAECLLQPEEFKTVTDIFRNYIRLFKISVYDEKSGKGLLRHIYIRKAPSTGEIMVCAVINGSDLPYADELLFELKDALPNLKSVMININRKDTNVVLGDKYKILYGEPYITDVLCSLKFRISPQSFYQVNHDTAELLYKKAADYAGLTGSETVLDLYCGTGTIGLTMADKAKKIIGAEIVSQAVEDAKKNAEINGITNAEFICGDASYAAEKIKKDNIKIDAAIVDPPRKGCSKELLNVLCDIAPQKIVYISCDSATLARDCKILSQLGYSLIEATPVDMFPRTPHVETVVLLVRYISTKEHVIVEVKPEELELGSLKTHGTYDEIKKYVLDKFGLKVSSLNISQVKRKCGLDVGEAYNKPKSKDAKIPNCPPEKEEAIIDTLKHFNMM